MIVTSGVTGSPPRYATSFATISVARIAVFLISNFWVNLVLMSVSVSIPA